MNTTLLKLKTDLVKKNKDLEDVSTAINQRVSLVEKAQGKVNDQKAGFEAAEKAWNAKLQDEKDAARGKIVEAFKTAEYNLTEAQAAILDAAGGVKNLTDV